MTLIKRLDIGRPITAEEMDANLQYLEDSINVGTSGTSGTSGISGTSGTRGTGGSSGSSGTSGTSGVSGEAGEAGSSGTSGTSGVSGEAGSSGTSGTSGAGTSGTSGTSISLTVSDGTTTVVGVRNITLSNLGVSASGSGGATITNFGGGGDVTLIAVTSGSNSITDVSTLRFNSPLTINDNGGGTVGISVDSVGGGGTSGTSGTSISLTIRRGDNILTGIDNITLTGSLFLESSGSNGAILNVISDSSFISLDNVVSSSQQIVNYDVFATKNTSNVFTGTQTVTGSMNVSELLTTRDLYVDTTVSLPIPEGNILVGFAENRSGFLPTASLTSTAAITVFDGTDITFSNVSNLKFTNDFVVQSSGSGVVVISTVSGSEELSTSGSGFPFSGSAVITGSLEVTGDITASAFAITSVGVPTIESSTNINLTAGGVVGITSSPLRLASFTDAQTGSITAQNGDLIYNSTTNTFMGFASGSWIPLNL